MNSRVTKLLYVVLIFGCFCCKKDQDSVGPGLFFKNLKDGAILWNSVTIELGIAHPESISKIDILANSTVVSTLTQSPFTALWNTQLQGDGLYELRAVSTDKQGNSQESKINIVIQNGLLSFLVPTNHLTTPDGQLDRGWIFLSSTQGELLAVAEMKNGEKSTLTNSSFNGGSFVLSEAYLTNEGSSLDISSFLEVPRGAWMPAAVNQDPAVIGNLSVQFKDSVDFQPYYISTSGDSQLFYEGGNSIQLKLNQSPSRLFMREIDQQFNQYNLVTGLTPNETYLGQFADLKKPLSYILTPSFPSAQTIGIRLYGFPKASSFDESYALGVFVLNQGQVKIEYPGAAFLAYGSENIYSDNSIRVHSFNPTKMYDLAPLQAQVIFNNAGSSKVTVATFGNFDIYQAGWGYAEKSIGFSWTIIAGSGRSDLLKLPDLPSALRNAGIAPFDTGKLQFFNVLQIADYEIAQDYKSYIKYISQFGYNSPYVFGKAWKEQTFSSSGVTGGGRKNETAIPTIKERLSRR